MGGRDRGERRYRGALVQWRRREGVYDLLDGAWGMQRVTLPGECCLLPALSLISQK